MYDFISHNYEPGDELFFFGFSRGAFTVRCVASLVVEAGILSAVNMTKFADMWEAYRNRPLHLTFDNSTWYKDNKTTLGLNGVEVKVIGVWDTVSALVCQTYSNGVFEDSLMVIDSIGLSGVLVGEDASH